MVSRKQRAPPLSTLKSVKVISAPPPLEKRAKDDVISPEFWEKNRYPHSTALRIGVSAYKDSVFIPLPYVKKDLELMDNCLRNKGFSIERIESNTSKKEIENVLNKLHDNGSRGDRVIVYFSGHGTALWLLNFLVPTNGDSTRKDDTCISCEWLKGWIDSMTFTQGVKHLLVILDACKAGLGLLMSKAETSIPLEALAQYPGAHMLTAGLMEDDAHIDRYRHFRLHSATRGGTERPSWSVSR